MCQPENSHPADSAVLGFYAVMRSVQEPILESIFWLALGYALGWQDKECVGHMNASEDQCHRTAAYQRNPV
jgi:hypothetical protein